MKKFSLIMELTDTNTPKINKKEKSDIKYQQYVIEVSGKEVTVDIPLREVNNFEEELSNIKDIDDKKLNIILRKYRGLME